MLYTLANLNSMAQVIVPKKNLDKKKANGKKSMIKHGQSIMKNWLITTTQFMPMLQDISILAVAIFQAYNSAIMDDL